MRALVLALVLVLAGVGGHALDRGARAAAVRAFTWSKAPDLERDLARVGRYEPRGATTCPWRASGDREALVRALITVESLATPWIEVWWKSALARGTVALGLRVPDLTYGPGRVRLATAREVVGAHGRSADAEVAIRLLDYCEAKPIVAAVVDKILGSHADGRQDPLNLAAVHAVARIYNGQAQPASPEAAVAHETYNALVYALFQRYRFDGLNSKRTR